MRDPKWSHCSGGRLRAYIWVVRAHVNWDHIIVRSEMAATTFGELIVNRLIDHIALRLLRPPRLFTQSNSKLDRCLFPANDILISSQ